MQMIEKQVPIIAKCESWADQPVGQILSAKSEGVLETFDGFRDRILVEGIDLERFHHSQPVD